MNRHIPQKALVVASILVLTGCSYTCTRTTHTKVTLSEEHRTASTMGVEITLVDFDPKTRTATISTASSEPRSAKRSAYFTPEVGLFLENVSEEGVEIRVGSPVTESWGFLN